ncbi:hypothetical protein PSEMO_50180 [Pseudomonas putida]|uniref:Uncharacterized protein n=1 Tax=Pseudomonas putida TaxID=303 RepID=A0A1Q9QY87_PSEPU|nr:hypothetical protein PSEMO_50180 [Pseudomonas putida]
MRIQPLGNLPTVETLAPSRSQLFQGLRLRRIEEHLPRPRRPPLNQEGIEPRLQHPIPMRRELLQRNLPLMRHHRRHRKPVPRQADRRLQQLGKRQPPKPLRQHRPGRRTPRHRHWRPAIQRHLRMPGRLDRLHRQGRRRLPVAIEPMQLPLDPHQRERIPAYPVASGLDHGQGRRRGDRGIDGIAALLHDLDAGLGG